MRDFEKYFVELNKMTQKYGNNTILLWHNGKFLEIYGYYRKGSAYSAPSYNNNYKNFNLACQKMELQVTRGKYESKMEFLDDNKIYTVDATGPPIGNFNRWVKKLLDCFNVVIYKENTVPTDKSGYSNEIVTSKEAEKYLKYAEANKKEEEEEEKRENMSMGKGKDKGKEKSKESKAKGKSKSKNKIKESGPKERVFWKVLSCGTVIDEEYGNQEMDRYLNFYFFENTVNIMTDKKIMNCAMVGININTGDVYLEEFFEDYKNLSLIQNTINNFYSNYEPKQMIVLHNINNVSSFMRGAGLKCQSQTIVNFEEENSTDYLNYKQQFVNCQRKDRQDEIFRSYYKLTDVDLFMESINLTNRVNSKILLSFALDFLCIHNENLVEKIKKPTWTQNDEFVKIRNSALQQLNIIKTGQGEHLRENSCVLNLMSKCSTAMGIRLSKQRLLHPTFDCDELEDEYEAIEQTIKYMKKVPGDWRNIKNALVPIIDIENLSRKIVHKTITLYNFSRFMENMGDFKKILEKIKEQRKLKEYFEREKTLGDTIKKIKGVEKKVSDNLNIDVIKKMGSKDGLKCVDVNPFNIKKYAKLHKLSIRIKLIDLEYKVIRDVASFLVSFNDKSVDWLYDRLTTGTLSDGKTPIFESAYNSSTSSNKSSKKNKMMVNLETKNDHTTLIMITDSRARTLKTILKKFDSYCKKKGKSLAKFNINLEKAWGWTKGPTLDIDISNLTTRKEGTKTVLTNTVIEQKMEERIELCERFTYDKKRTYNNFLIEIKEKCEDIEEIAKSIAEVDFLFMRADIAKKRGYSRPTIEADAERSFFRFEGIRHPIIERILEDELYVSNNLSLGTESESGMLLFGTNAVGKSSLIKSIGINILLAQSGFFVAAKSLVYHPYRSIFTRILGNDDIFRGQSTFAVEMCELKTIVENADEYSLVLGDEMCSSTDMISALSIFSSGILTLVKQTSTFVFATHFHDIMKIGKIRDIMGEGLCVKHMTIKYDEIKDILTYERKLKDGQGNQSYGLEVCRMFQMDREFMDMAQSIRLELQPSSKNISMRDSSSYNRKLIKTNCFVCGKKADDVHHLRHQKDADEDGMIEGFIPKNSKANLVSVCRTCHNEFHNETNDSKKFKKKKTTCGYVVEEE